MYKLRNFTKWLAAVFNPPYQLTLSDTLVDKESGQVTYVFKQYGLHEFVHVTYADIISNGDLLKAINPVNLLDVHLAEHERKARASETKIQEILRGARFKLSCGGVTEEYSAEYIVNNVDMFTHLSPLDLCSIAYTAGFRKGRSMSKEIRNIVIASTSTQTLEVVTPGSSPKQHLENVFELRRSEL